MLYTLFPQLLLLPPYRADGACLRLLQGAVLDMGDQAGSAVEPRREVVASAKDGDLVGDGVGSNAGTFQIVGHDHDVMTVPYPYVYIRRNAQYI